MIHYETELEQVNKLVNINQKVVVYFWATWCGPCKVIAPKYEELSKKLNDWTFIKVDIDEGDELAEYFQITSLPTFYLFKNKTPIDIIQGADLDKLTSSLTNN